MDNFYSGRMSMPITTGTISPYYPNSTSSSVTQEDGISFKELLEKSLADNGGVEFSKHAVARVEQRNIEIDGSSLQRLNEGVRIAQEKGLDDALILIDKTAFVVSAQNNKVITTVSEHDLKGNVFTNIDGTVII